MSKSQPKRSIFTRSDEPSGKNYKEQRKHTTRQSRKRSPSSSSSQGDYQHRTIKHRLRNSQRYSPYGQRKSRVSPVPYMVISAKRTPSSSPGDDQGQILEQPSRKLRRRLSHRVLTNRPCPVVHTLPPWYQDSTIETSDAALEENIRSTREECPEKPSGTSSESKLQSTESAEYQLFDPLDRIMRDEIIRKTSTCLSFYGNFVIIPAIKETLDKIEKMDKNIKFSYWHEIMTFIDSYDLPYASEPRKKLIDQLVEKITEYVESEGVSDRDWQNIICTLPDDISSKFDHRLEENIMEEVSTLAEQDQLPFNLSKPILQLLQSARKHAGKHIRINKN